MAADDEWWSGVSQRSDDVRVERPDPLTDPLPDPLGDPLTGPLADPLTDPLGDPLPEGRADTGGGRHAGPPPAPEPSLFEPVAAPPPSLLDPTVALPAVVPAPPAAPPSAQPPAPVPPSVDGVLDADGDVPFWLLPPPPRPNRSAPAPAAGAAPRAAAPPGPAPVPAGAPATGGLDVLFGPRDGGAVAPPPAGPAVAGYPVADDAVQRAAQRAAQRTAQRAAGASVVLRERAAGMADNAAALLGRASRNAGPLLDRARAQASGLPRGPLVAGAAAAVGLLTVVVAVLLLTGGGGDGTPAASTSRTTPAASPSPVEPGTVAASASSVQDADGGTTYEAANTLDGKLTTAWNSDGGADASPVGITLRYTFADPVDLRSVSIANGYQKVVKSGGKNRDLYAANARVKEVKVVTDAGEWTFTLKDAKAPQALRKAFGTTKTVTLEIVSVYKGSKYPDIGISEVAFTGVAAG